MTATNKHFAALDGLRGIAVLIVVLSHLSLMKFNLLFVDFSGIGKCGVYLFFVLSAFLLTYQFFEKGLNDGVSAGGLGNYFWRRSLRVLPLFYLVVLCSGLTTRFLAKYLMGHGLPFTIPPGAVIPHLLLQEGTGVLWSVPVEFKFYFLLPLIAVCFLLTGKKGIILDAIFTACIIYPITYWFPSSSLQLGTVDLRYFLPVFMIGSFCASLAFKTPLKGHARLASLAASIAGIVLILTVPSIYSLLIRPVPPSYFQKSSLLYGLLWAVFLYMALHAQPWFQRALTSRPLVFMGRISFSVYLLHFPILLIGHKFAPGNRLVGWLSIVVIIGVSSLSYRWIERPLSRIRLLDIRRLKGTRFRGLQEP